MNGWLETSQNISESIRAFGDRWALTIGLGLVVMLAGLYIASKIQYRIVRSKYYNEFIERRRQRERARADVRDIS